MKQLGILKSICLILVLCMILLVIVACDREDFDENNTTENSSTEKVIEDNEVDDVEKDSVEEPTTEAPTTEEPTTEEPATEEPTTEEPTGCEHEWKDATCEAPRTCLKCNETDGNVGNCNEGNNGRCIYCNKQMRSTEGLIYEISDDGTYVTLTGYIGTNPVVIIADEYQGVPVTKFTWQTFAEKKHIEEIYINNNITEIPDAAFKNCINLMKIEMPDTVTSIWHAFAGCTRLEEVVLSNGLIGLEDIFSDNVNLKYNEYDNAFYLGNDDNPYFALIKAKNKSITSCAIHEDTKIIAGKAFMGCLELKDVIVSESIIIGNGAFAGCPYLDHDMDFDSFIKAEEGEYVQV